MVNCSIVGCTIRSDRKGREKEEENPDYTDRVTFHRFPQDPNLREAWVKATLKKNWEPAKDSRICSRHFKPDSYQFHAGCRRLRPDAVPSSYLIYLRKPEAGAIPPQIIPGIKLSKNLRDQKKLWTMKLQSGAFCAVKGCLNMKKKDGSVPLDGYGQPIYFYEFPENAALRQKWVEAAGEVLFHDQLRQTKTAICSVHFDKSCFAIVGKKLRLLQKNAVPTLALPKIKPGPSTRRIPFQVQFIEDVAASEKPSLDKLLNLPNQGKTITRSSATTLIKLPVSTQSINSPHVPRILRTSQSKIGLPVSSNTPQTFLLKAPNSNFVLQNNLVQPSTQQSNTTLSVSSSMPQTFLLQAPNSKFVQQYNLAQPSTTQSYIRSPASSSTPQTFVLQAPVLQNNLTQSSTPQSSIKLPASSSTTQTLVLQAPVLQNNLTQSSTPQSSIRLPVSSNTFQTLPLQNPNSKFVIKNDLAQPVVFVNTHDKVMVMPAKSATQKRLAGMTNATCVQVNPNSYIQVQPPKSSEPETKLKKPLECTCPTNKFFRDGDKQIRVLSDREHRLRSKIATKTRMVKSLQLSRNRSEDKCQNLKKQVKDLRKTVEKKDLAVPASPSTVKLFREFLKQHSQPINLDGPMKMKYGKEMRKFAVQLFLASPEAYRYVRDTFNKRLPRAKTIREWYKKAKESKDVAKRLELNIEETDQINSDDQWDSDLDDESIASEASSDEELELRKSIRKEVSFDIQIETDGQGNVLNDLPPDLKDERISDEDSDSEYEMSFATLCEPGLIIPSETSDLEPALQPKSRTSKIAQTPPVKKLETVVKVNSLKPKTMGPGVRFETFAI